MSVYLPDTADLSPADIRPKTGLKDSTPDLGDGETLDRRLEDDGYLFFRGMIDPAAAEAARLKMAKVLFDEGLISNTGRDAEWIGGERENPPEESPAYAGICQSLFDWPGVAQAFEKLMGEPATLVPMVQYRAYKPNIPTTGVHQDGFYSPGIAGYRPVWLPLNDIDEEIGGLTLAPRQNKRGFLHNLASPRPYVPAGVVPEDAWLREDYRQGDALVLHPYTPHIGLPNRSKRIRYSLDTRVQSAARPSVIEGEVTDRDANSVTIRRDNGELSRLAIDDETFIRVGNDGTRMSRDQFVDRVAPGRRIMASREGDKALMLRHAFAG